MFNINHIHSLREEMNLISSKNLKNIILKIKNIYETIYKNPSDDINSVYKIGNSLTNFLNGGFFFYNIELEQVE